MTSVQYDTRNKGPWLHRFLTILFSVKGGGFEDNLGTDSRRGQITNVPRAATMRSARWSLGTAAQTIEN
jgi:hypothetical protein